MVPPTVDEHPPGPTAVARPARPRPTRPQAPPLVPPHDPAREAWGALVLVAALLLALFAAGCGVVPKARLDDARKVAQALRAENSQLRDKSLGLKGEVDDLTHRAIADGRRISALEDANGQLETSVQAYIDEREELNDSYRRVKRLAESSAGSAPGR